MFKVHSIYLEQGNSLILLSRKIVVWLTLHLMVSVFVCTGGILFQPYLNTTLG